MSKRTKILYRWTPDEDWSKPDGNYVPELQERYLADPNWTLGDLLFDEGVSYEEVDDIRRVYYVLNKQGLRTGEAMYEVDRVEVEDK